MEMIITTGPEKLEAIKAIRQLTGTNLHTAKEFIELSQKNYTVAISEVSEENMNYVIQVLASAGVGVQVNESRTPIFRSLPFNPNKIEFAIDQSTQEENYYFPTSVVVKKTLDASLKGYLKEVATLECQLWNQDRLIERLTRQYSILAQPKTINKPKIDDYYVIDEAIGSLTCAAVAFCISVYLFSKTFRYGFFWALLTLVGSWVILEVAFSFLFFKLEDFLALPTYRKKLNIYQAQLTKDQRRIEHELHIRQEINQQIISIKVQRQRTQKSLNALYSLSIIHRNYRNLIAVSSFYDYFDKRICTRLEGRDGAYAFYEEALRFQRIESKLDIIIEKLDQIAENQQYLAALINEGNATLNRIEKQNSRMFQQINAIQENTAITEYNTRCSAESLSVMENISIYRFLAN